jgi:3,4-dihydroxy 2-butanone 4-phosphate synthase/GTP cyclohydrolase II
VLGTPDGGVLDHPGQAEAAVDLVRAAGLPPVAVLAQLVTPDHRQMADRSQSEDFARDHGLQLVTVGDLIRYCGARAPMVRRAATTRLPTELGIFACHAYDSALETETHLALTMGDLSSADVIVRLHRECLSGDVFHSARCGCRARLHQVMGEVAAHGAGVVLYLRGRLGHGAGLAHGSPAGTSSEGRPGDALSPLCSAADEALAAQILADLGVGRQRAYVPA